MFVVGAKLFKQLKEKDYVMADIKRMTIVKVHYINRKAMADS
jgi:hypothetical protein